MIKHNSKIIIILIIISKYLYADLDMRMPLECDYGKDCFIQNYVDIDSTSDHLDYKCGYLTYNKHKGTDFRLKDLSELKKGVNVLAVQDGVVKAIRDDQPDFAYLEKKFELLKGKECGNGVAIQHQNGYISQYCHLLKNSVTVQEGDKVEKGQAIGLVGMSGNTEFPHIHVGIRKNDNPIDPFTGLNPTSNYDCGDFNEEDYKPLWDSTTIRKLKYIDTAILNFHSTDKKPTKLLARTGRYRENEINETSDKLILWADIMGVKKDDIIKLEILDQDKKLFNFEKTLEKKYVLYFVFAGKKLENLNLKKGLYTTKISIYRNNNLILNQENELKVL